jgi:transposase-like protein
VKYKTIREESHIVELEYSYHSCKKCKKHFGNPKASDIGKTKYSKRLKSKAVQMVCEESKTLEEVSVNLSIPLTTIYEWINKEKALV